MTRLNPSTTPRHQLRAEKARLNREAALSAFAPGEGRDRRELARLQG